ncbi:MAG: AAA family ATPase, partial [Deltaproteobacteria bacterium]|nr:AAA family ATPase [Deltaproteobacteria bacterium]
MPIIRIEAENLKRLKLVCIETNGKPMLVIGGKNAQGKTSLLDAVWYALGGKPDVKEPIRQGESKAHVTVETEDYIITRNFTPKGNRLEVVAKGGKHQSAIKSPQALLDKMMGDLAFDPLAFSKMDAKPQS